MPKQPLPMKHYKCKTSRIINKYYQERINHIKNDYIKYKPRKNNSNIIASFMMSLISIVHYFEVEAARENMVFGKNFFGISGTDLIKWFEIYSVNNQVQKTLQYLTRERILLRTRIHSESYYVVNSDIFTCKNGSYCFKYKGDNSLSSLFIGYCDICHYCNYNPNQCMFNIIFPKKISSMTSKNLEDIEQLPIIKDLNEKLALRNKIYSNLPMYKKELSNYNVNTDKLTDLEIYHFYIEIKSRINVNKNYDDIIKDVNRIVNRGRTITTTTNLNHDYLAVFKKADAKSKDKIILDDWGFNPLMISIMNILNIGREDAKDENIIFPGFSMYHIEQMLKKAFIANESVYDNLYRLQRMNLVQKLTYDSDEGGPKNKKNKYYYDLNDSRFYCVGGIYIFYYPETWNEYKIFNGVCPYHHLCNKNSTNVSCSLIEHMENIARLCGSKLSDHFKSYLQNKFNEWKDDFVNYLIYKENFKKILELNMNYVNENVQYHLSERKIENDYTLTYNDIVTYLDDSEIAYYGKELTINYGNDRVFRKIIDTIIEIISMIIIRDEKKRKKETSSSTLTKTDCGENKTDPKNAKRNIESVYLEFINSLILAPYEEKIKIKKESV